MSLSLASTKTTAPLRRPKKNFYFLSQPPKNYFFPLNQSFSRWPTADKTPERFHKSQHYNGAQSFSKFIPFNQSQATAVKCAPRFGTIYFSMEISVDMIASTTWATYATFDENPRFTVQFGTIFLMAFFRARMTLIDINRLTS